MTDAPNIEALLAEARIIAAQAWCQPTTQHLVIDPALAEVFAQMLVRLTLARSSDPPLT